MSEITHAARGCREAAARPLAVRLRGQLMPGDSPTSAGLTQDLVVALPTPSVVPVAVASRRLLAAPPSCFTLLPDGTHVTVRRMSATSAAWVIGAKWLPAMVCTVNWFVGVSWSASAIMRSWTWTGITSSWLVRR